MSCGNMKNSFLLVGCISIVIFLFSLTKNAGYSSSTSYSVTIFDNGTVVRTRCVSNNCTILPNSHGPQPAIAVYHDNSIHKDVYVSKYCDIPPELDGPYSVTMRYYVDADDNYYILREYDLYYSESSEHPSYDFILPNLVTVKSYYKNGSMVSECYQDSSKSQREQVLTMYKYR